MSHQYSYDQKTLGNYYLLHRNLMDYWLSKEKNNIFVLDNEELVQNQETITKKLIEFCDLEWEDECLEFHKNKRQVRTASIEQVRQPMNSKSIGAWKKYENYLTDLKEPLKMIRKLNYFIILFYLFLLNNCGFQSVYKLSNNDDSLKNYLISIQIK